MNISYYPTNFVCDPWAKITLSSFLNNVTLRNAKFLPILTVSELITIWSPIFAEFRYLKKQKYNEINKVDVQLSNFNFFNYIII